MRRIAGIEGRSDDMLIIRGVNVFPSQLEELILGFPAFGPHFEIELTRPHRMDEVLLKIEPRLEASDEEIARDGRLLVQQIKDLIGVSVGVLAAGRGSLGRSNGKALRIRDLRPH